MLSMKQECLHCKAPVLVMIAFVTTCNTLFVIEDTLQRESSSISVWQGMRNGSQSGIDVTKIVVILGR